MVFLVRPENDCEVTMFNLSERRVKITDLNVNIAIADLSN
jgi:hypothetical protein